MTSPTFFTDEDFREDIVRTARSLDPNVDIVGVRDVGMSGSDDPDVLQFAFEHSQIVLSHDANTMIAAAIERIADGRGISGLFIVSQFANRRGVADDIVLIANATDADEWFDVIDYLPM